MTTTRNAWRRFAVAGAITAGTIAALPMLATRAAADDSDGHGPSHLPSATVVAHPPTGAKGPDDLTRLAVDGLAHGRSLLWTAFQNGIGPDGTAGPSGVAASTVAGYDPGNGSSPVATIQVPGKVDGLTADPGRDRLIATVNEDNNSALDVIDPGGGTVTKYKYNPNPSVSGNGGTDSVAVKSGRIFIVHSNPNDASQAAEYEATLDAGSGAANLRPVFLCNSAAKDAVTGAATTLALTDPDTSAFIAKSAPRFGGQLATVGQGDGQIVFASHLDDESTPKLTVLNLSDNTGTTPQVDGLATATSDHGTLYVVDNKAGSISALDTAGWPSGTVFVGSPNGLGTLDLSTGKITALSNTFQSPKGLLFVPPSDD